MQKFWVKCPKKHPVRKCLLSKYLKEMKEHAYDIWEECSRLRGWVAKVEHQLGRIWWNLSSQT